MKNSSTKMLEPTNYYQGVKNVERLVVNNVILFQRTNKENLQQKQFSNKVHHRYVLIYVKKTSGSVNIDGNALSVKEGDLLLILPYQFHHFSNLADQQIDWLFITFELDHGVEFAQELQYQIHQSTPRIQDTLHSITQLWKSNKTGNQLSTIPLIEFILTQLQTKKNILTQHTKPQKNWLTKAESLIRNSLSTHESIEQLAIKLNISERHLRTKFQNATGVTPKDFKANYQLHLAYSLINSSSLSLSNISSICGFANQSSFNVFIKRKTGKTPKGLQSR